ncbi:hypothetical protein AAF712_013730 [Marasmius tenuissimus]|uniref:Cytochrome P450 n=1 Tax=Marasmius tenuissimus TaxID=585030 RepID=A0ABR2ZD54_9AGAR
MLTSILAGAFILILFARYRFRRLSGLSYPPGPRKLPLLGNLLAIPISRQWVKFREWALEYGPIYHLKAGPVDIIVLNTPEATEDLLVKRARVFDDRLRMHVSFDIVSAGSRMALLNGGSPEYKLVRKAFATELGPFASRGQRRIQELESIVLLYDLLQHGNQTAELMGGKVCARESVHDPEFLEKHWFSLIRRFSTSLVMEMMYGERVHKIEGNKDLHEIYEVVENVAKIMLPGAFIADTFTFLQKLPDILSPWRLKAQEMHKREIGLYGGFLTKIRTDHESGVNRPECFVGNYLKARESSVPAGKTSGRGLTPCGGWLRDTLLAYSAGTVLEAGSDTTSSTIVSFVMFMLWHPPVLEKAREEIDRVVGETRLPTYEDEDNLPYVAAIIKEVLRCRPPFPVGAPHRSTEDTTYKGYFIPKGSVVIGNVWALNLDSSRFKNPTEFNPDRWMQASPLQLGEDSLSLKRDHYTFGWGRRFCMGSHIAEASLFIVVAQITWGLDIHGTKNSSTGVTQCLDPWDENNFSAGVVSALPFNATFKARSSSHKEVIERSFKDAQGHWEILGLASDERY